ncbi:MAG: acyl-CoA thioesterase [Ferruginibacter sp.]
MDNYSKKVEIRWADLDPNFHMLHSKYYDLGGYCRMSFLVEKGITTLYMKQNSIGPILFREECIFKREVSFGDDVSVNLKLQKITTDGSRWTMLHEIWKNTDTLAALITCDGAWMETTLRKLAQPPGEILALFEEAPKTDDFIIFSKDSTKK